MSKEPGPDNPNLDYLLMAAHQMQSPVSSAGSLLRSLLTGAAGPLNAQQIKALERATARCEQAMEAARRMIAIARADQPSGPHQATDIAAVVGRLHHQYSAEAAHRGIQLKLEVEIDPARVIGDEAALIEAVEALLNNAFKYTPDQGAICIRLRAGADAGEIMLSVADSGVGIAEQDRERVFQPFFRTAQAQTSSRPGTGLGLAFVKTVVEAAGGKVSVNKAGLGGAELLLQLRAAGTTEDAADAEATESAGPPPFRVVIVGGVAAGPKAAAKIIRLMPDAQVTIVEQGRFLSYAGCGLPYYISGVVRDQKELMSTPLGSVRDPIFFQQVKNVRVMGETQAIAIDRAARTVRVRDVVTGAETLLVYDKLVLATGAVPVIPDIPGAKLGNVFTLHGVYDAEGIKSALARGKARDVAIIGGGLLGVEITEALAEAGCRVTIIERLPQILRILDWEIACLVEQHLEARGVKVLTGTTVERLEGDGAVRSVMTSAGPIPADMVILAIGVQPNVALAREAGLEIGTTGAIEVDERMRTSDADIYAAGDCVQSVDILTHKPCYVPLGSTANKQGRVAAMNICGMHDTFPGVLGSTICKVFDYCVARTGLTETSARELGYEVVTVLSPAPDRAHYMPNARPLLLKLIADRKSRRLLGAQATGPGAADKRIDVVAMALTAGLTVDALANADLCYAPPYAEAMDNLITAANIARNKIDGVVTGITPMEVREMLDRGEDFVFLDVRSPLEYERVHLRGSTLIPLGSLRSRLHELPRNKPIVTFGMISLRGYEAALWLQAAGYEHVRMMDGGIEMWPYEKLS